MKDPSPPPDRMLGMGTAQLGLGGKLKQMAPSLRFFSWRDARGITAALLAPGSVAMGTAA